MARHAMVVLGTRPEALKLAPVIMALRERPSDWRVSVVATGQHREMLAQALGSFALVPDSDLDVMVANQTLAGLTSRLLTRCDALFGTERPDVVLVQGDTATVLSASLAAYYNRIPVAHVEAGLRTNDPYNPFPEEMNRRLVGALAHLHFSPTAWAARQLMREGIDASRIEVTGNTIVDALQHMERSGPAEISPSIRTLVSEHAGRLVLVTCHRRESFGPDLGAVIEAIARLAERFSRHCFFFPVHLNPNVREQVMPALAGIRNVVLSEPVDYATLLHVLKAAELVITDSGGIQEEAPSYGVPFIVARRTTERPEGIKAGFGRLVPPDADAILALATRWLTQGRKAKLAGRPSPYGDGRAAERIVARLTASFAP
ncbi:UDP-N-acetylglucosamine 2-epimerase (non-hydrolyzing) [Aurantimonas sp. Leaf443]|uniref:non-hydrolyzing UDP-N-acetylglucosamine 2-epimerase n=1 Tax=Aurantimonas sp. Leaf443 TaxID=1736378 RepID=UPI0006F57270|nr:UDP-N-acetylglucosamine 2-epimerase (non-hydrolyzing) [Aurantimonas sp. Leaf443]KQT85130.1 UDP-N-acetyl glucosamine 2-epimerase [Aurantimonas sp. Leaf443]